MSGNSSGGSSSGGIFNILRNIFTDDGGPGLGGLDWSNIALALGGLYGVSRLDNSQTARNFLGLGPQQPTGYQGQIPRYTAQRSQIAQPPDPTRRPGSAGRRYFTPMQYAPKVQAATGGLMSLPRKNGFYLGGPTDGMTDQVPATINGQEEAALSHGEFIMPADVVSHLGNGNSEAGAKVLYDMMARIRQARTGNPEQGRQINPHAFIPGGTR